MNVLRAHAIATVARRHGVSILEHDAYALAPELTYLCRSTGQVVGAASADLATPDTWTAARIMGGIRATATMASPLTAALATTWIEAEAVLHAILRAGKRERNAIAASNLLPDMVQRHPDAFHAWLSLSEPWTRNLRCYVSTSTTPAAATQRQ